ncbi:MAG: DUF5063 domain-containing protein [Prevotella sp.]|jgi:hypothetical protein|nr:DUF5063 domain-containing protein [Prevotella sp.]
MDKEEEIKQLVFSKNPVEFVTVAVQYCALLENLEKVSPDEATDKFTKILPLLYLKALLLPETELIDDDSEPETIVTEEDYNYIVSKIYAVYGKDDTYLEVFLEDMKYSETPISASISEDLADIYQDLKNFVAIYERGVAEQSNDAMFVCSENFKAYWGQKLVNVLGALHSLKYSLQNAHDEDYTNLDDSW